MQKPEDQFRCSHTLQEPNKDQHYKNPERELFSSESKKGVVVNQKFGDLFFNFNTTKLTLIVMVHVVGIGQIPKPIVSREWIDSLFDTANEIWSQACVTLGQVFSENLITEFRDVALSGFINCLPPENSHLVDPYEVKSSEHKIVNLFLVEDTNGIACASPFHGRIFLPTTASVSFLGRVLAHEVGHLLLNPIGINTSPNPRHLMFHGDNDSNIPIKDLNGMHLSDCIGARETLKEEYLYFGGSSPCKMTPKLGNNLAVIATHFKE